MKKPLRGRYVMGSESLPKRRKVLFESIKIKWLCEQGEDYMPEARSLN